MHTFDAGNLRQMFPEELGGVEDRTLAPLIDAAFDEFVASKHYSRRPSLWREELVFGYFSPLEIRASNWDMPVLIEFVRENYEAIRDRATGIVKESIKGVHGNEFANEDVLRIYNVHPLWAKEHGGEGTEEFYKSIGAQQVFPEN